MRRWPPPVETSRFIHCHVLFVMCVHHSSRIFIVMLHLYGAREDTKIWEKIISAHAKKCSRIEVSVTEVTWVGQKANSEQTSRGMNA